MIYHGLAAFCLVAAILVVIAGMLGLHRSGTIAADEWAAERAFLEAGGGLSVAKLCVGPEWLPPTEIAMWTMTVRTSNSLIDDYIAGVAELGHENTVYCDARGRA